EPRQRVFDRDGSAADHRRPSSLPHRGWFSSASHALRKARALQRGLPRPPDGVSREWLSARGPRVRWAELLHEPSRRLRLFLAAQGPARSPVSHIPRPAGNKSLLGRRASLEKAVGEPERSAVPRLTRVRRLEDSCRPEYRRWALDAAPQGIAVPPG